ncbi:probable protein phosphatase 2C BIPP2C1 [Selaginella moellendorffii]|uniref:probable protein phosphatase 2C BIPP2C1 n=1 Tax=Selaginella moellendorffii TaxID=88036 RepID=UPI000D1C60BE|nr:probable protein phosphatase 2C BIPP2C1 [Selaginella moellendorffii]XP_024520791.1 probable protein phosphatase 2C BIPP2C1 [Selaginella moellendorffii]|eukprot:XP_024520790.1 probable protein phosphatase 2C BIPP2C1 [Selaginella moellendorffii]
MRRISWAGRNAGMALSMQQDKAVTAIAAAAAAGCSLSQQQPWQRRASAGFARRQGGFDVLRFAFGGRERRLQHGMPRQSVLFSKLPFDEIASQFSTRASEETTHVTFDESAVSLPQPAKKFSTHNSACKNGEEGCQNAETDSTSRLLRLDYAAAMRPHPEKAQRGGEDAFFTEGSWMGVADGVGGWAGEGIDSGMYSRELMGHCKALVVNSKGKPDPKDVLVKAAGSTKAQGSATVLVAALFEQTLYAANLGDSGFIIVRNWQVVASSEPMQHSFNFPFQVGTFGDHPTVAEEFKIPVCKGDIIVLGTDGLFDNLFSDDIIEVLKKSLGSDQVNLKAAAADLVAGAQAERLDSPFARAAAKARMNWSGGKLDDTTAVVAFVT